MQMCGTGWGWAGYTGDMRKITVWICLLSLGTSASAQTAASLRSELLDLADSALEAYSTVQSLGEVNRPSATACASAGSEVIALGNKIRAYIDRTKPFFDAPANQQNFYIRQASGALFASVTSMLTAVNRFCSPTAPDPEVGRLHFEIADLKLDIFQLHLFKASR